VRLVAREGRDQPPLQRHGNARDDLKDNNIVVLEYHKALAVLTNTALQDTKLAQRSFEVLGANGSAVLRPLCGQILADEGPHLRFQCERLAMLFRGRRRFLFGLTLLAQRLGFLAVMVLVWVGHRRALRAGGYSWRRYWRAAWDRMGAAWQRMDPRRYAWT